MAKFVPEIESLLTNSALTIQLDYTGGAVQQNLVSLSPTTKRDLGGLRFVSLIAEDITLDVTSTYTAPFEQMMQTLSDSMQAAMAAGNMAAAKVDDMFGKGGAKDAATAGAIPTLNNFSSTMNIYSSTQRPTFNVGLTFIRTSLTGGINPVEQAAMLYSMAFPLREGNSVVAPGGFRITGDQAEGTWTLRIGNWMLVEGLCLNSVSPTISGPVAPDGIPLWATCTAQLETWILPDADQVRKWFIPRPKPVF